MTCSSSIKEIMDQQIRLQIHNSSSQGPVTRDQHPEPAPSSSPSSFPTPNARTSVSFAIRLFSLGFDYFFVLYGYIESPSYH